jgi:hypothetical protein
VVDVDAEREALGVDDLLAAEACCRPRPPIIAAAASATATVPRRTFESVILVTSSPFDPGSTI